MGIVHLTCFVKCTISALINAADFISILKRQARRYLGRIPWWQSPET
jgi:hypothetical protein